MAKKTVDYKREITGIIYLAFSLLFGLSLYLRDGIGLIGKYLRLASHGFVGIIAYLIPILFLYMALDYFFERESRITRSRLLYLTVLILSLSAIAQVFFVPFAEFKDYVVFTKGEAGAFDSLKLLWTTGYEGFNFGESNTIFTGGLVGGVFGFSLVAIADKAGAAIILIVIALSEIILVFNISFTSVLSKTRDKVDTAIKQTVENIKVNGATRPIDSKFDVKVGKTKEEVPETDEGGFELPEFLKPSDKDITAEKDKDLENRQIPVTSFFAQENANSEASPDYTYDSNLPLPDEDDIYRGEGARDGRTDLDSQPHVRQVSLPGDSQGQSQALGGSLESKAPSTPGGEDPQGRSTEAKKPIERPYVFPPINLLNTEKTRFTQTSEGTINSMVRKLESTLESFGIAAKVVNVTHGPVITRFELIPGAGVKISRIVSLADDIALNLAAMGVRIEAPIPGKSAIGIEVPNNEIAPVSLKRLIESPEFQDSKSPLSSVLGRDIPGNPVICEINTLPHLLIAGATGSGKSVCLNSILISILYKASPKDMRLIMIDPKVVELGAYNGIPHLYRPVVTDPKKASKALKWAVAEMTRRYALLAESNCKEIGSYNNLMESKGEEKLPFILIIIDELSDLMATSANEVEDSIARLTAMARAAGMHLIIATQRPSVDVITGVIKANIPARISFAVSSQVDSRTILDMGGAEKLLGRGDMLYSKTGGAKPVRAQGAFVTEKEVQRVTDFIKSQNQGDYDEELITSMDNMGEDDGGAGADASTDNGGDEFFVDAVTVVLEAGQASISYIQRRLNVGYPRAARLIDTMQERGIIGGPDGSKPRKILITKDQWAEYRAREGV